MAEILLTNDDGVRSPGITSLAQQLRSLAQINTVAPDQEQSATSQSLTLLRPIHYEKISSDCYSVSGTPTDCVLMALNHILPQQPDLVISGINRGPNLGYDIAHSGTVAGAMEAARHGLQAVAISLATRKDFIFDQAVQFVTELSERLLTTPLPKGVILNVNIPAGNWKGVKITRQSSYQVRNLVVETRDPRGRTYFWLDQDLDFSSLPSDGDTDDVAVRSGYISMTPLKLDQTAIEFVSELKSWSESFSANKRPVIQ